MLPFGNETVTLVRRKSVKVNGKTEVYYVTVTLTGCSWRRKTRIVRNDNALLSEESIICRIPADSEEGPPMVGDLLILGDETVTVTSGIQYQNLIEAYRGSDGAFVVASVSDNARPGMPMPHYAARS